MRDQEVTFRRIRGRIVPIRKKRTGDLKKAAGYTAAGAGVGVASVLGASELTVRGKKSARRAQLFTRKATSFLDRGMMKQFQAAMGTSAKAAKNTRRFFKASEITLKGGQFLAGGIIGLGIGSAFAEPESEAAQSAKELASFGVGSALAVYGTKLIKKRAFPFLK